MLFNTFMETNVQDNITNDVQETTGTYLDYEKHEPKGTRVGVWGSIWGVLKDQLDLIAYIDERINALISEKAITDIARIENEDVDGIIDTKETQNEVSTQTTKPAARKKRIVVIS